ncbi:MAG: hypothetical protein HY268_05580 [Deltaproteobacteria bacterium]|nr:hypothetical protein [Deltaproteobacteria bacterium]
MQRECRYEIVATLKTSAVSTLALKDMPNEALQRIAARVRFLLNLKRHGWAAAAEACPLELEGA